MTHDELRAKVREILDRAQRALDERRAAGLCLELDCTKPPIGNHDRYVLGDDHCEEHARKYELEFLIEDQQDDADGVEP